MIRYLPRIFVSLIAWLMMSSSQAWIRPYVDYDVESENGRFVAALRFSEAKLYVYEVKENRRDLRWQIDLWTPIGETVHLSDDGAFIVIEDHYPYTQNALRFYHEGSLINILSLSSLAPRAPQTNSAGGTVVTIPDQRWHTSAKFCMFSQTDTVTGSESVFCLWFSREPIWRAWSLKTGDPVPVSATLSSRWNSEAADHAEKSIARFIAPERAGNSALQNGSTSAASSFHFLHWLRPNETKEKLEFLRADSGSQMLGLGMENSMPEIRFGFPKRQFADLLLAEWEGKIRPDKPLIITQGFTLGNIRGILDFASDRKRRQDKLWLWLTPSSDSALDSFPSPRASFEIDLSEIKTLHDIEPRHWPRRAPSKWAFELRNIIPGDYLVRAIWRPPDNPGQQSNLSPVKSELLGVEGVPIKVTAGGTATIRMIRTHEK